MVIQYTRENIDRLTEQFIAARNYAMSNERNLREKYKDKYIAVLNGKVIDSDENCSRLWGRRSKKPWKEGDINGYPVISTIDALIVQPENSLFGENLLGSKESLFGVI